MSEPTIDGRTPKRQTRPCSCKRSVQLLAHVRVDTEPLAADVQVSTTIDESLEHPLCPRHATCEPSSEKRKLRLQLPKHTAIIHWFENELGPKFHPNGVPSLRAQVTADEHTVTLYYDSRFDFNCFSQQSVRCVKEMILDTQQLEESQHLALMYFGPRRVPSGFRRRQKLLHQLYQRYERRGLQCGWERIKAATSVSSKINARLLEILSRNLERSRRTRLMKRVFSCWSTFVRHKANRLSILERCLYKHHNRRLRKGFILWYRNAATSRVADLLKDFGNAKTLSRPVIKRQVMSIFRNDSQLAGRFSPDVIVNVLMNASSMLSPCVSRKSFCSQTGNYRGKARSLSANSQYLPSTPPLSPYSPCISSCSPKNPLNLVQKRQQNSGGGRRILNGMCYPPRPLKIASRVVLESETPDEHNQSQKSGNTTSNDLSAWRKQALLQQKKLRSSNAGMLNASVNSEGNNDYANYVESCTPLSAQLVSNWSFMSSAAAGGQGASPCIDATQIQRLEGRIDQYVRGVELCTPATSTTIASTATGTDIGEDDDGEGSVAPSKQRERLFTFLSHIELEKFLPQFEKEDLCDLDMLVRLCIDDRKEFKRTLSEVGISKIGQREKLIFALLEQEALIKRKKKKKKKKSKHRKEKKHKERKSKTQSERIPKQPIRDGDTAIYNAALLNRHKIREQNTQRKMEQHTQSR